MLLWAANCRDLPQVYRNLGLYLHRHHNILWSFYKHHNIKGIDCGCVEVYGFVSFKESSFGVFYVRSRSNSNPKPSARAGTLGANGAGLQTENSVSEETTDDEQ